MTRKKKSRKPGVAPTSSAKEDKKKALASHDKKPKKHKGKKAGSRQLEATKTNTRASHNNQRKDSRVGSKKPIELIKLTEKSTDQPNPTQKVSKTMPSVRVIDNSTEELEQEIYAIEEDERLQQILEKQEQESALTEQEVEYYNEKMDRHQTLRELLGWDDDESIEEEQVQSSEDALWDKLDNPDFSEFE